MPLLLFVSLVLAISAILFFLWNQIGGSDDHTDRLAILPFLDELDQPPEATKSSPFEEEQPDEED